MRAGATVLMADTVRLEGSEFTEATTDKGRQSKTASFRRASGGLPLGPGRPIAAWWRIADGQLVTTYFPRSQTYSQALPSNDWTNNEYGRLKFGRDPARFHDPALVQEESLEYGGKQVACYVVRASYRSMIGDPSAYDLTRNVWIAKSNEQILRDVWDYWANPGPLLPPTKLHVVTDYLVIETGIQVAAERFVFNPPPGSRMTGPDPNAKIPQSGVIVARVSESKPEYTPEARAAGLQGTVSLYVEVDNNGHAVDVEVMQGLGLGLDQKAVEAVRHNEYKAISGVFGVQSRIDVDVQFRLDLPAPWSVAGEVYSVIVPKGTAQADRQSSFPRGTWLPIPPRARRPAGRWSNS